MVKLEILNGLTIKPSNVEESPFGPIAVNATPVAIDVEKPVEKP